MARSSSPRRGSHPRHYALPLSTFHSAAIASASSELVWTLGKWHNGETKLRSNVGHRHDADPRSVATLRRAAYVGGLQRCRAVRRLIFIAQGDSKGKPYSLAVKFVFLRLHKESFFCKFYTLQALINEFRLTMVQAVSYENGGSSNGHDTTMAEETMPNLTTMPGPDANWQISLKDKVIAVTGANRGWLLSQKASMKSTDMPIKRYWSRHSRSMSRQSSGRSLLPGSHGTFRRFRSPIEEEPRTIKVQANGRHR